MTQYDEGGSRRQVASPGSVVAIERVDPARGGPELGRECRFAPRGQPPATIQYVLEHEGVLYPHPLECEPDQSVRLYPEAPGHYVLHAAWCSHTGETGWARTAFVVAGPSGGTPQRVRADGETLWVPTPWDARLISAHESTVFAALRPIVRQGATVFDIGANVGLFSLRFMQWIGAGGWLYAIEANPVCVYFLRANLEQGRARNFTILPVALSSGHGECSFRLNYGSSLIGVGSDSPGADKPGHRIVVPAEGLDRLIARFNLRPPDFIKLDVEGAEASAVAGMSRTLETRRPGLMIELHGREAASETLRQLTAFKYRYLVASTGARFDTADALCQSLPDACVQVIACP